MQYSLMTMFSVNMLLKLIISSSVAVMWSLIHVLQLFRYILFINIQTPDIMENLISYLGVVIGDIEDVESIMPDLLNIYAINSSEIVKNVTLYAKFSDNGKVSRLNYRLRNSVLV